MQIRGESAEFGLPSEHFQRKRLLMFSNLYNNCIELSHLMQIRGESAELGLPSEHFQRSSCFKGLSSINYSPSKPRMGLILPQFLQEGHNQCSLLFA